jgi:predicted amidohydrolase
MAAGMLKVATCQFAVSGEIARNGRQICDFLSKAKKAGADIVHLPECALSGYAGIDFETLDGFNWELLKEQTQKLMSLAGKLKIWVVLGSIHRLTGANKPHNSLYLIGPNGRIIDRYDKRFCMEKELTHYTPGDRFVIFTINGVRCSLLICFDLRFPELYREIRKLKADCVFQSFYNARQKGPSVHTHIMRQTMQSHAATNFFWVSGSNASGYYSPYPSFFIQPDGKIVRQLQANRAGMMINTVNVKQEFYDPSASFRKMVMNGKLSCATRGLRDPRSKNTTIL